MYSIVCVLVCVCLLRFSVLDVLICSLDQNMVKHSTCVGS